MATVSVIVPAHNAGEYIGDAVRSALDQSLRDIEVIVIDDASADGTAAAAFAAANNDPRFVLLQNSINSGPGPARNYGFERATGEWIALLDADDTYAPDRLQRLLQLARDGNADLTADNLSISTTRGAEVGFPAIRRDFMSRTSPISAADLIAMDRPSKGTQAAGFLKPIMRAGFLRAKQIRYDRRFRNGEDFHFYVQALLHGARFLVSPEAGYRYWFRTDSQCRGSEAAYPQQLIAGNDDLLQLAVRMRNDAAIRALRERRREIDYWIPYSSFVADLKKKNRVQAMRSFCLLPSRTYALHKLWEAAIRRLQHAPEVDLAR